MATSGDFSIDGTEEIPPEELDGDVFDIAQEPEPTMEFMYISENKVKYTNPKYKKVEARMYDCNCDVKLRVGDTGFKAHRSVLSEASDYFAAMFTVDMKEKEQPEIELKEMSPKGFTAILEYFYHGILTLEPQNIEDILEAARFFHVDWIIEMCSDFLVRHLSWNDYSKVMYLTDRFILGDLRLEIFQFIGQNFENLTKEDKFYENASEELLLQFLMEYLYVDVSEKYILDVIVKWVKQDEGRRKEHLLPLLRQIRFPLLDIEELDDLPAEVLEYLEIRNEVEEAKKYALDLSSQCLKNDDKYLARGSRSVIIILSFTEEGNAVVYKEPENDNLFVEQLAQTGLDVDYSSTSQAGIGNFLYAVGGYSDAYTSSDRTFRYDPRLREWTEVAPMKQARVSFAICSSDRRLYVFGGMLHTVGENGEEEKILSEVEMYVPEENCWKSLKQLPYGTFDQSAVYWNNTVYITGGISGDPTHSVPLSAAFCLPLDGDEWQPLPDMTSPRQGHSMTPLNGRLYVLGGYTASLYSGFSDSLENELLDLETKQWTKIKTTPATFGHLYRSVALLDKKIYFLCGLVQASLNSYDTETDEMEEGVIIGANVQKAASIKVAYPYT
ncbi:hypothetical protein ACJMK2_015791 [Sinanodonta woodiana]|uniref:BTB domain-containing protein n=1 Tax=Sinanodonta woodiana TaxID=1069815 RepID=A0ABD3URJ5_SINWO